MISSSHNRLFSPGGCLTAQALRDYAMDMLSSENKKLVREHIKNCKLCAEALEGFKKHGRDKIIKSDLKYISRRVRHRYSGVNYETGKRLSILVLLTFAALLFILLGFFYIFRQSWIEAGAKKQVKDTIVNASRSLSDSGSITH